MRKIGIREALGSPSITSTATKKYRSFLCRFIRIFICASTFVDTAVGYSVPNTGNDYTLGTAGVISPLVSVLWSTVKHIRQGSREISLLHSSGQSNVPLNVQQAVLRLGMSIQKLSLYTPAGQKAAGEGPSLIRKETLSSLCFLIWSDGCSPLTTRI